MYTGMWEVILMCQLLGKQKGHYRSNTTVNMTSTRVKIIYLRIFYISVMSVIIF